MYCRHCIKTFSYREMCLCNACNALYEAKAFCPLSRLLHHTMIMDASKFLYEKSIHYVEVPDCFKSWCIALSHDEKIFQQLGLIFLINIAVGLWNWCGWECSWRVFTIAETLFILFSSFFPCGTSLVTKLWRICLVLKEGHPPHVSPSYNSNTVKCLPPNDGWSYSYLYTWNGFQPNVFIKLRARFEVCSTKS